MNINISLSFLWKQTSCSCALGLILIESQSTHTHSVNCWRTEPLTSCHCNTIEWTWWRHNSILTLCYSQITVHFGHLNGKKAPSREVENKKNKAVLWILVSEHEVENVNWKIESAPCAKDWTNLCLLFSITFASRGRMSRLHAQHEIISLRRCYETP